MFGPEASGLANKDLSFSNYILQIPTSKNFKSINLSHSVTIVCYEIFKLFNKKIFKKKGKSQDILKIKNKLNYKSFNKFTRNQRFFIPKEKNTQ